MSIETALPHAPRTARRTVADRLREALAALAGGHGAVVNHSEKAWASVTFAGARHTVVLRFAGPAAVAAGETLIAELPEHEFAIPGQLVADATVTAADHRLLPEPLLTVTCELLLLEEA
jgi:hypothetical protein